MHTYPDKSVQRQLLKIANVKAISFTHMGNDFVFIKSITQKCNIRYTSLREAN